jgi:carboxyl-terminal processing protease
VLSKKTRLFLLVGSILVAAVVAMGVIYGQSDDKKKLYRKFDIFVEVLNRIRNDYVEPVQPGVIFDGALKGMARMLDIESSYLTKEEYERYQKELPERKASTGIEIIKHPINQYAMVIHIIPGSPASESAMKIGDFIRTIDNASTREMPIMMANLLLCGQEGSSAEVGVIRSGVQGQLTFEIERKVLPQESITFEVKEGNIGYIKIPNFNTYILEELQRACDSMASNKVRDLIIDLRGNVHGDMEEAYHAAELFVEGGKLFTLKTKNESTDYAANKFSYSFNVQILCDDTTARAAEIFALSLQDTENASVVGKGTFGLGAIQKEIILEDGAYLNISYATIIGAKGTELQGKGITPDVEVETNPDSESDKILEKAIERAKEKINQKKAA